MLIIGMMIGATIGVVLMCIVRMWDVEDAKMAITKFYDALLKEYKYSNLAGETNEYKKGLKKTIDMYKTYFDEEICK